MTKEAITIILSQIIFLPPFSLTLLFILRYLDPNHMIVTTTLTLN